MCIAIVKPYGTKLPSKAELRLCWENNPDGAGFMYNDGEKVNIFKGFMKFKTFYKALLREMGNIGDTDLVMHFRIATSGGVKPECCHPFPVTKYLNEMRKTQTTCEYGFAHNGIIKGYGTKDYSDTMHYNANVISNIHDLDNSEALLDALATENSSRFAILTKDNFLLGGDWIYDNGCYYSNDTYKESRWSYTKWAFDDDNYYKGTCKGCGEQHWFIDMRYVNDEDYGLKGYYCDDCYKLIEHELRLAKKETEELMKEQDKEFEEKDKEFEEVVF